MIVRKCMILMLYRLREIKFIGRGLGIKSWWLKVGLILLLIVKMNYKLKLMKKFIVFMW